MLESVLPKWFFPHFSCRLLSQRPVLCLLQNDAAKNCIWCNDSHLVSQNNFLGGKWQSTKPVSLAWERRRWLLEAPVANGVSMQRWVGFPA